MKKRSAVQNFLDLTPAERKKATAEFDREFVADTFRPLNAKERSQWSAAKRRPGRPKLGKGSKVISVSIEESLLKQTDRLAKRLRISRAGLIARSLRSLLEANSQR
jgi:hypothetical protein